MSQCITDCQPFRLLPRLDAEGELDRFHPSEPAVPMSCSPQATREDQILEHLPYVKATASCIHQQINGVMPFDDLVSAGSLGLIRAVDTFNPDLGVQLRTYADCKIRGAIMDALRRDGPVRKSQLYRRKEIEAATERLAARLQRMPEPQEVAAELGIALDEYHKLRASCRFRMQSLERPGDDDSGLIDRISQCEQELPSEFLERDELQREVAGAIKRLPPKQALVITLYFLYGMKLQDIADVIGLHQTRVHQIKKAGLSRLKRSFGGAISDAPAVTTASLRRIA